MKNKHIMDPHSRKNTHSVKWDLIKLQGYDPDVLPLWVADMDFSSEPHVSQALSKVVNRNLFGYHLPVVGYTQSVLDWLIRRHGVDLSDATMINTMGVIHGIASAINALTELKDHILVFEPVYHPFKRLILSNKRRASISPLTLKDGRYTIDFELTEQLMQQDRVRMIIFCSPHNPVGRVWEKDELNKLMQLCMKYDVVVLSDEIHMDF